VHLLSLVLLGSSMTACVVPPPLEVETQDAGINSPPVITAAFDPAGTSLRPPATLVVNTAAPTPGDIDLTLFDLDITDELTVKMFVDFVSTAPLPALGTCIAPGSVEGEPTRSLSCSTSNLCVSGLGEHRLELEVYDRPPDINDPYRTFPPDTEPGMFSTWTLDLTCVNNPS